MKRGVIKLCWGSVFLLQTVISSVFAAKISSYHVDHGLVYEIMVHPDNGDVFLGAKNGLIHLNSELRLQGHVSMGPYSDSPQCSPDPTTICRAGRVPTDNQVCILEYDQKSGSMLVCGSVHQGKCEFRSTTDISQVIELKNDKINFVGSINKRHVFAFFGGRAVSEGFNLLFVAMGDDGRPPTFRPAAISTRKFHIKDKSFQYLTNNTMYKTYVDVHPILVGLFKAYYIHGFEYENHTYFISVQMDDALATAPKFLTKIVRICQDDQTYASYTELPIQCMSNSVVYNIAIGAYYHSVSARDTSTGLAVTFGRTDQGSEADPSLGSVLCFYDMLDILKKFEDVQDKCFLEGIGSEVTWLVGKSLKEVRNCETDTNYTPHSFCGLMSNIGIQESAVNQNGDQFKLSKTAVHTVSDALLTSVALTNQNRDRVAILGSNTGHVSKIWFESETKVHYLTSWNVTDKPLSTQTEVGHDNRHVFLIADQTLYRFPLYTCDGYSTCEACVMSRDPAGCGWCGDHCSLHTECLNPPTSGYGQRVQWQNDTCPPVISQMSPMVGPTKGQTKLTLKGINFGSARAMVKVSINGSECNIEIESRDKDVLQCRTPASKTSGLAPVLLEVEDRYTAEYKISGTSAGHQFHYKVPTVEGIFPSLGPVSGGTELLIKGKNLDIGSNLAVFVGATECSVQRKNSTAILCLTGKMATSEIRYEISDLKATYPSLVTVAYVRVQIDSSNTSSSQMFAYVNDSTITSIQPKTSIVSGGLEILVKGTNLNVVQQPQIAATVKGKNSQFQTCTSSADGTMMTCFTPSIKNLLSGPVDPNLPEIASVWFKMDDIRELRELDKFYYALSRFTYYPDPTFEKFDSVRLFDISEDVLILKGEHIDKGIAPKDAIVTIGNSMCKVYLLKSKMLYCKPQNKPTETDEKTDYTVQVKVGQNLQFTIGRLQYVGGPSSGPPTLIIVISIVLVIVIILIIVLIIVMKKRKLGVFRKKGYAAGYANGQGQVRFSGLNPDGTTFDFESRENRANDYQERHASESREDGAAGLPETDEPKVVLDESTLLVLRDKKLLIEHDWLTMGEILGRGHFGCVYKGYITYPESKTELMVAVKTLHQNSPREIDISQFIDEAMRMKDFHHPNVLTLIGICFNYDAMPLVILPYMEHGDLLTYIRNEHENPTIKDLILFAVDIAKGMEYLSLLKVVHRDLACRNCMLNENYRAIVADFGLSRDIYERDYYSSDNKKSKLPVKWMAPESLEKGTYSSKSDVWSFGVVLWELMTRGVNPYPEVDNWDVLRYIKKNRRMPQPPFCPDPLYTVMRNCWEFNPMDRPQFSDLVKTIMEMLSVLEHKMKQGQHRSNIQSTYVNVDKCTDYHYGNLEDDDEKAPLASPLQTDL